MRLSLSPTTYLEAGPLIFRAEAGTELDDMRVRVSRTGVMGGGAVTEHYGQYHADRTLKIRANLTEAQSAVLFDLLGNESAFTLSTPSGLFFGTVESRTGAGGQVTIRFLVSSFLAPGSESAAS